MLTACFEAQSLNVGKAVNLLLTLTVYLHVKDEAGQCHFQKVSWMSFLLTSYGQRQWPHVAPSYTIALSLK